MAVFGFRLVGGVKVAVVVAVAVAVAVAVKGGKLVRALNARD